MKNWVKFSLTGAGLVGTGVGFALWSGASRWNSETLQLVEKLKQSVTINQTKTVSFKDLTSLPAPVARYFRLVLQEGQPIIRVARIKHTGEFNLNDKWIPFESIQHFSPHPAAFVWDAKMQMNRLMNVRVRDGYSGGKGLMQAKIYGLFTVADAGSNEEHLASGALMRFLAESTWLPTALLPNENLQWSSIDNNRALATLTDAGVTVSLEFEFNETGEIIGIFSPERFREYKGKYKPFPWSGRFWDYQKRNGMRIPLQGEVEWQMPEGNAPYWRGRITEAEYEF